MRALGRAMVAGLLLALPGCLSWKQVHIPAPPAPPMVISRLSKVTLTTRASVEFVTLVVAPDSVFGIRSNFSRTRMTISRDQIARVEERRKDAPRTLALIAVMVAAGFWSGITGFSPK